MLIRYALFILLVFYVSFLGAQDFHFSNYRFAPLTFNPANTGHFLGNLRLGANARSQYSSFFSNPYQSVLAYVDAPLEFGLRKKDWVGIGLQLLHDKAGDLGYENNLLQLSGSYFIPLSKKNSEFLGIGFSYLLFNRKFANAGNAIFPEMNGNDFSLLQSLNKNGADFNIGLNYKNRFKSNSYIKVDFALSYLKGKKFKGINQENGILNKFNASFNYGYQFENQKTILEGAAYYSKIDKFNDLSIQLIAYHKLRNERNNEISINAGLGYRIGDALQFITGGQYKSWNLSFSWDMTISSAKFYNNYNGAFELGLYKIFVIHKNPKLVPIIFCPRF